MNTLMIIFHPGDFGLADWFWLLFVWGIIVLVVVFHIVVITFGIKKMIGEREKKKDLKNDLFETD